MTGETAIPGLCRCGGRHGFTRLVTGDYVCANCGSPTTGYESTQTSLAYFVGGPLNGKAYSTADLMNREVTAQLPVEQYHWTAEKRTSALTDKIARVWEWNGPEVASATPEDVRSDQDVDRDKEHNKMQNTTSDGQTNTQLLERRKALGLSRTPVAEKAGITVSQLGSMETAGKRVKPGVMDKVAEALSAFEKERGTSSEPTDKESHTPAAVS